MQIMYELLVFMQVLYNTSNKMSNKIFEINMKSAVTQEFNLRNDMQGSCFPGIQNQNPGFIILFANSSRNFLSTGYII